LRTVVEHVDGVVRGDVARIRPPTASVEVLDLLDRLREAAA